MVRSQRPRTMRVRKGTGRHSLAKRTFHRMWQRTKSVRRVRVAHLTHRCRASTWVRSAAFSTRSVISSNRPNARTRMCGPARSEAGCEALRYEWPGETKNIRSQETRAKCGTRRNRATLSKRTQADTLYIRSRRAPGVTAALRWRDRCLECKCCRGMKRFPHGCGNGREGALTRESGRRVRVAPLTRRGRANAGMHEQRGPSK
jgi:hypothetical protein